MGGEIGHAFEGVTTAALFGKSDKAVALAQTGLKLARAFVDVSTTKLIPLRQIKVDSM